MANAAMLKASHPYLLWCVPLPYLLPNFPKIKVEMEPIQDGLSFSNFSCC